MNKEEEGLSISKACITIMLQGGISRIKARHKATRKRSP